MTRPGSLKNFENPIPSGSQRAISSAGVWIRQHPPAGRLRGPNGGFGHAPKFPPSMALSFLLRSSNRTGRHPSLEIVEHTLQKMAHGGIYDQLGGGFHRYSVDDRLARAPFREDALRQRTAFSRAYLDAYLLTGNRLYRRIAEETLDYVLREMTSPEGDFTRRRMPTVRDTRGSSLLWKHDEVNWRSWLGRRGRRPVLPLLWNHAARQLRG